MTQPTESKKRRRRWGDDETDALIIGCMKHGVGNWQAIIKDPTLTFDRRSAVDLKDRFRTICPKREYQHLYTQQNISTYYLAFNTTEQIPVHRKKRRMRRPFNEEEDQALLKGVEKYGVSWACIAKDPDLNLSHRKGGDIRDRFRNKYPDRYEALGLSLKSSKVKKDSSQQEEE
ncbi:uncharacterized protein BX664DRAFT_323864 [Halteromyces radiatus]|uniref:uncharacterized protein n=1 Tax=Halteromyces radiatus TaxID=101107 RepID=UPI00222105DF|nr:uncharacterized protein BX664DRAFT_323864 [Halteromyces radiatus]KAI8096375.1 hypothetical protein BX664DRAFT_323864 [Halteromyces radiatus]